MREFVIGGETLQQKSEYAINVLALTNLLILHGTDLLSRPRFGETQATNSLADAIASWSDRRRLIAVFSRPIIVSRGKASQIAGDLQLPTSRTNHESPLTTQPSHEQPQFKQCVVTRAQTGQVVTTDQVIRSTHNGPVVWWRRSASTGWTNPSPWGLEPMNSAGLAIRVLQHRTSNVLSLTS